jgi:hypothetical protein
MLHRLKLTQNKFALLDKEDFIKLNKYKWYAYFDGYNWYAARRFLIGNPKRLMTRLHTFLMKPPKGKEVDHINGDSLDNRRKNLRICTHSENCQNRKKRLDNTSGFKGVYWSKRSNKWVANIQIKSKRIYLGGFISKIKAAEAYQKANIKYHGKFSRIS